jgi:hypothetical protein
MSRRADAWFVTVGAASLLTMPLTAIWFLLLGPVALMVAATVAALRRSPLEQAETLRIGVSIGLGLLVGPAVYLSLALIL